MLTKGKIIIWLFIAKVKSNDGVHSSFIRNRPHCAMFERSGIFLNDKEKAIFRLLKQKGFLKITGTHSTTANREYNEFIVRPIYKVC